MKIYFVFVDLIWTTRCRHTCFSDNGCVSESYFWSCKRIARQIYIVYFSIFEFHQLTTRRANNDLSQTVLKPILNITWDERLPINVFCISTLHHTMMWNITKKPEKRDTLSSKNVDRTLIGRIRTYSDDHFNVRRWRENYII